MLSYHVTGHIKGIAKYRNNHQQRAKFSQTLRQMIKKAGFGDSRIKGHSFRIGAATTAASLGFTVDQIQSMGRWRSDAVKKYIRITSFTIKQ